jgi:hypothetical protein
VGAVSWALLGQLSPLLDVAVVYSVIRRTGTSGTAFAADASRYSRPVGSKTPSMGARRMP